MLAILLLVLFPIVLMFETRVAYGLLAIAIVLLYTGRGKSGR